VFQGGGCRTRVLDVCPETPGKHRVNADASVPTVGDEDGP
jgi:hypothetical protein